jgi:hypothetical protein
VTYRETGDAAWALRASPASGSGGRPGRGGEVERLRTGYVPTGRMGELPVGPSGPVRSGRRLVTHRPIGPLFPGVAAQILALLPAGQWSSDPGRVRKSTPAFCTASSTSGDAYVPRAQGTESTDDAAA